MEILDADRLGEAKALDERYAVAKLVARAFNDPQTLWSEHEAVRHDVLAAYAPEGSEAAGPDMRATWEQAHAIHQRLIEQGLVLPLSEAN